MNLRNAPQPIPYQGSKRRQVPIILRYILRDTATLWEPFVGSGATTIGAALANAAQHFVVGDSLEPLVGIWRLILTDPDGLCDAYERIWNAHSGVAFGSKMSRVRASTMHYIMGDW